MSTDIAIYLPSLRGGGAERVMVMLANGFVECGYRVDLVLAKAEGVYLEDVSDHVQIVDLDSSRVLASLPKLVRYLRRNCPATMLSALSHANFVAFFARTLARTKTRLVVTEHSHLVVSRGKVKALPAKVRAELIRWIYPLTDAIVTVSRGIADDLVRSTGLMPDKIQTIHNPVVSSNMLELSRQPTAHPWFNPGEPPVVLGVGRLTMPKDFSTLIRAFAKLHAERPVRLMILGEGELRSELEELVRELRVGGDVALPGFVTNPYCYMRQAALYVMSSSSEAFGNTLAEAMACGTQVVAIDCPSGPAEILEQGTWGRLVPIGSIDALSRAMAEALDESDPPDVMIRAKAFTVERAVAAYLKVLIFDDEVLSKS